MVKILYFGHQKRGKYHKLWFVQYDRNLIKNFIKKVEKILKKYLKFPDECVIIFRLTFKSDEAEGGHSAEFSPAFMGNFRGASPA